jgi:hypothetical protein
VQDSYGLVSGLSLLAGWKVEVVRLNITCVTPRRGWQAAPAGQRISRGLSSPDSFLVSHFLFLFLISSHDASQCPLGHLLGWTPTCLSRSSETILLAPRYVMRTLSVTIA